MTYDPSILRDPVPPKHGEGDWSADPGEDPHCWCGRPLNYVPSQEEEGVTLLVCSRDGVIDQRRRNDAQQPR